MEAHGELLYREFVIRLSQRVMNRFVDGHIAQKIGRFFWPFMSEEYKTHRRGEDGRQAFWNFALMLKRCLVEQHLECVYDLWQNFDQNAKNLFVNFCSNCLDEFVNDVL